MKFESRNSIRCMREWKRIYTRVLIVEADDESSVRIPRHTMVWDSNSSFEFIVLAIEFEIFQLSSNLIKDVWCLSKQLSAESRRRYLRLCPSSLPIISTIRPKRHFSRGVIGSFTKTMSPMASPGLDDVHLSLDCSVSRYSERQMSQKSSIIDRNAVQVERRWSPRSGSGGKTALDECTKL